MWASPRLGIHGLLYGLPFGAGIHAEDSPFSYLASDDIPVLAFLVDPNARAFNTLHMIERCANKTVEIFLVCFSSVYTYFKSNDNKILVKLNTRRSRARARACVCVCVCVCT